MKKWEIKVELVGRIVELPDDAVVLDYESDEDNGEVITYMVPVIGPKRRKEESGK